jgi:opacity protein-like surface antigen
MKKVILSTLMLCSIVGFSQNFKFGAKAGLNVARLNTNLQKIPGASSTQTNVVGLNIGLFGEYKISDTFSLQPELLYSEQGGKATMDVLGQSLTQTLSLKYLNVPVIAKYFATKKFSIQAGPQIGFLLAATNKLDSSITGLPSSSSDIKSDVNAIDFGLNFGLGYDFTENIAVSTRYNLGLIEIEKNNSNGSSGSKNKVFSFGIEYKF